QCGHCRYCHILLC
nr:immunoglobulin heavy chain junction region [Mus musculus]